MTSTEYIQNAKRTEVKKYQFSATDKVTPRIEHAIMGITSEAGELTTLVKDTKVYGQKFRKHEVVSQIGDIMWYLAIICDEYGLTFEDIWDKNIRKLKVRFPEGFTDKKNRNRDYKGEAEEIRK